MSDTKKEIILRPFQREGVDIMKKNDFKAILADSPGLGKTIQVLYLLRENIKALCPAIIIAPSSIVENWRREAESVIPGCRVQTVKDTKTPIGKGFHLTIIPWDMLHRKISEIKLRKFKFAAADEAHYAKGGDKTRRGRALKELSGKIDNKVLMSGTPIVNKKDELEILKLFFDGGDPVLIRRLLEDVAKDIPKKTRVKLKVEIPSELRDEYDKVHSEFEDWIDDYLHKTFDGSQDESISVSDRVEKTMKAEPLAKISYLRRVLGRAKVPAAAAWIKSMLSKKEPVVVFGMYIDVIDVLGSILSNLKIPFVRLDGTMNRGQRQVSIDAFNSGKVDVFISSMAGREGLTLIRKDFPDLKKPANLLMMERWYTPAAEEQAEDRVRRIGQTRETFIWQLHACDTIDDRIDEIIENKRDIVREEIGSSIIEKIEPDNVMDLWKKLDINIREAIPRVSENPDASINLPKISKPKCIHAVIFDVNKWSIYAVQRYLRMNGCRQKKLFKKGNVAKILCRSQAGFKIDSIREMKEGEDFIFLAGKPAVSQAERMRNLRFLRQRGSMSKVSNEKTLNNMNIPYTSQRTKNGDKLNYVGGANERATINTSKKRDRSAIGQMDKIRAEERDIYKALKARVKKEKKIKPLRGLTFHLRPKNR